MSLVQDLTPVNLLSEKAKFFADQSYNPQFTYSRPITLDELYRYGLPQEKYKSLAKEINQRAFHDQTETEIVNKEGAAVSDDEVKQKIIFFLQMHNLEDHYRLIFSDSFVARAAVSNTEIKLRTPLKFLEQNLLGMIYHELGTHALRQINYEQQPFFKKRKQMGFTDYLRTEEGLAVLHGLLPYANKIAYKASSHYLASSWAQTDSFSELWHKIAHFIDDPDRRWNWTLRQKRGLTDTSQPGGFTKDLVYFEGFVDTWRWLQQQQFDITDLYRGKIAFADVGKAKEMNPLYTPLLPSFFSVNKDAYKQQLYLIGKTNHLEQSL